MGKILDLTEGMALLEAMYLRNMADHLERLALRAGTRHIPILLATTMTDAWRFTQVRVTPQAKPKD